MTTHVELKQSFPLPVFRYRTVLGIFLNVIVCRFKFKQFEHSNM